MKKNSQSANSPAYQFYPKDYLSHEGVQLLSLEEEGAYTRAMAYSWRNGNIPADPEKLARLIGKNCTIEIAKVIATLFEPLQNDATRLIHPRHVLERKKQKEFSRKMSESGKKGANARWDSGNRDSLPHSQAITRPMASDGSSSSIFNLQSSSSNIKKPPTPKGVLIFPNWVLEDDKLLNVVLEWIEHRKEKRSKLSQRTFDRQLKKFPRDILILSIQQSIEQGWTGLFEPNKNKDSAKAAPMAQPKAAPILPKGHTRTPEEKAEHDKLMAEKGFKRPA